MAEQSAEAPVGLKPSVSVGGNWGWFEDGPEASIRGGSGAAGLAPSNSSKAVTWDEGDESAHEEVATKKKGRLLHIDSELMRDASRPIVVGPPEPEGGGFDAMAVTPPTYVLSESLSNQKLWKQTAGNRPPQPVEERQFFEQLYAQNFARSKVEYNSFTKKGGGGDENEGLTVLSTGDNGFGTTMSKSFPRVDSAGEPTEGIDTLSVSIASYRVVQSKKDGKYAQYLVIFCDGDFRNTIGVWKRYSDFSELSRRVTHGNGEGCVGVVSGLNPLSVPEDDEENSDVMENAITSWKVLKNSQMWYRCLDADYLKFKVFLLERFIHDVLLESSNPQIIRDFVGELLL